MPSSGPVSSPKWIYNVADSSDDSDSSSQFSSDDESPPRSAKRAGRAAGKQPTPRNGPKKQARRLAKDVMLGQGADASLAPWDDDTKAVGALVMAGVQQTISDPQRAIVLFDAAFAIDQNPTHVYWRATAEAEMGEVREAIADLDACIESLPRFADAWNLRGEMYRRLGYRAVAMRDYNQALSLAPHTWEFRMKRGLCHFEEEDWGDAIADLEVAKRWSFFEEEAWVALVTSLINSGDGQRAREVLQLAQCHEPDSTALAALVPQLDAMKETRAVAKRPTPPPQKVLVSTPLARAIRKPGNRR